MNSVETNKVQEKVRPFSSAAKSVLNPALVCFVLGVIVSMVYQLSNTEPRTLSIFDSRKYIETARLLGLQIENVFLALQNQPLHHIDYWFKDYLMFDGPTLSLVPAIIFTILGKTPTPLDWPIFAFIQSVYHGFTALMTCLVAEKITGKKNWGLVAGVAWAICPPAVIASSRFLTEGLSVFLMTAAIYFLCLLNVDFNQSKKKFFSIGLSGGLIQSILFLTKPALGPACALGTIVSYLFLLKAKQRTAILTSALGFVIGVSFTMVPWLVTTKQLTGQYSLSPKRVPLHNLAKGMDWESDGYETYSKAPIPVLYCGAGTMLADKHDLKPVLLGLFMNNPTEVTGLFFRKITRLFLYPWNSFSNSVFGLSAQVQVVLHWILSVLAVLGSIVFLARISSSEDESKTKASKMEMLAGSILLLFIAGHLVFLPFETMARYGFTAIPIMIIFAVYFLNYFQVVASKTKILLLLASALFIFVATTAFLPVAISITNSLAPGVWLECAIKILALVLFSVVSYRALLQAVKMSPLAKLALVSLALLGSSIFIANSFYTMKTNEWSCRLAPGEKAIRTVVVNSDGRKPESAFLLIDGDKGLLDCKFLVNGQELKSKPDPILSRAPKYYGVNFWLRTTTNPRQQYGEEVRGWRVLDVPVSLLKLDKKNVLEVQSVNSPVTVYGDYEHSGRRHVPEYFRFSTAFIQDNPGSFEGRTRSRVGVKAKPDSCELVLNEGSSKTDLSRDFGKQSGEYRLFVVLGFDKKSAGDVSTGAMVKNLTIKDFNPFFNPEAFSKGKSPDGKVLITSPYILKKGPSISTSVELTDELKKELKKANCVKIRLSGSVKSTGDKETLVGPAMYIESKYLNKAFPNNPPYIKAGSQWRPFVIEEVIPNRAIPLGLNSVNVALYPGPWEQVSEYGCDSSCGESLLTNLVLEVIPENKNLFPEQEGRATY